MTINIDSSAHQNSHVSLNIAWKQQVEANSSLIPISTYTILDIRLVLISCMLFLLVVKQHYLLLIIITN